MYASRARIVQVDGGANSESGDMRLDGAEGMRCKACHTNWGG